MATRIKSRQDLQDFLAQLRPRQEILIVFSGSHSGAAPRALNLVSDGLLTAKPMDRGLLQVIGQRGLWRGEKRSFIFQLTDDFHQPDASQIAAEILWPGVESVEVVLT